MGRSCISQCIKVFLIIFNLQFLICGGFLLGIGIWMHLGEDMTVYVHIIKDTASGPFFDNIPYILIGMGAFVCLLSFLGCCGACAESVCFLCLYTLLLVIVLAAQITCGSLISVYKDKIRVELGEAMERQVRYNYTARLSGQNKTNPISTSWNFMQVELKCCGARGPGDYMNSYWYNITKENEKGVYVPATCCALSNRGHQHDYMYPQPLEGEVCQISAINGSKESRYIHLEGCHTAFVNWVKGNTAYIISAVVGVVILQIILGLGACVLMSRIRREQSKYPWKPRKETGAAMEKRIMLGRGKKKA